jgi:hypothetical protein
MSSALFAAARLRVLTGLGLVFVGSCSRAATRADNRAAGAPIGLRNAHVLAYDAKRERVILFGGADDRLVSGETWSWDGRRWSRVAMTTVTATEPVPRTFAAIAHDPRQRVVFMYGGHRALFGSGQPQDTVLADFWRWDGARWSPLPAGGPGPRAEASLAYDQARDRLVLFGGYRVVGRQRVRLGDTWEWNGVAWALVDQAGGPTPRNNAAMAYDSDRRVTVLFGGSDGVASGETWEWNGIAWHRSEAPVVAPRYNPVMVYDPVRRRLLRFGGWTGKERAGDTWSFDGRTWTVHAVDGPAPRNHSALAFDVRRGRAVLFGGHDGTRVFGDTWEWTGERWVLVDSVSSRPRIDNGH